MEEYTQHPTTSMAIRVSFRLLHLETSSSICVSKFCPRQWDIKHQVTWIFLMPGNVEDCGFLTVEKKGNWVELNENLPQIFPIVCFSLCINCFINVMLKLSFCCDISDPVKQHGCTKSHHSSCCTCLFIFLLCKYP